MSNDNFNLVRERSINGGGGERFTVPAAHGCGHLKWWLCFEKGYTNANSYMRDEEWAYSA